MATSKTEATVEDLYHATDDGEYELVDGRLVRMSPTGYRPGRIAFLIAGALLDYEERIGRGAALADGPTHIVNPPHRRSLSPDASYTLDIPPEDEEMKFINGVPIFAVEVRSANDYGPQADREYREKCMDYFAAGTQAVWDVDPVTEKITSYRAESPTEPLVFSSGQQAHAEPALPGWSALVDDLFARKRR